MTTREMPKFIPGLELNRGFYYDVIRPLLYENLPGIKYSAGLVGHGSDVLGYDTPQSMDHNWGPQARLFLEEKKFEEQKVAIDTLFRQKLPYKYRGFSTNYTAPNEKDYLVQKPKYIKKGPVNHMTEFHTIRGFFNHYLSYDPYKKIRLKDWLIFPEQALLEVAGGEVWHDDLELEKIRKKFEYYPDDVWVYLLAVQWGKIANLQGHLGRTGQVGDELGSRIVAIMIVRDIMRLCFLMERKYPPYIKWFGTAFSRLNCFRELNPHLEKTVAAGTWKTREKYLGRAYEIISRMHNELKITKPMHTEVKDYHGRPFRVVRADLFYEEIKKQIKSPTIANLKYPLGAVDQFVDHIHLTEKKMYTQFLQIIH